MKRELIMLRKVKQVYKLMQSLTKQAKSLAVNSYYSYGVKNGTVGQVEEICRLIELRDDCLLFCSAVSEALNAIDEDSRNLLKQYYIDLVKAETLAARLDTTPLCVYNRLSVARLRFGRALDKLGCNDEWLRDNFSHIDFLHARLSA